jgi:putative DNA methylase
MTDHPVISPKKLIEVALPLDAINAACAREKSIRHGHPSTLHLWWARRPLAAARAVIFGQLVHDPEDLWRTQNPGVEPKPQNKSAWTRERARLFKIIEDLVLWENTTNEVVLEAARAEIRRSWKITCELNKDHPQAAELFNPDKMPGLHDPFAGGGAIPLEAQRLGLEAYASDLNPVAVLINKAMIEIPPRFAGNAPVHPGARNPLGSWVGAEGLAEDVRKYGEWMLAQARERLTDLYPKASVPASLASQRPALEQYAGRKLNVLAWIWARAVPSPNPAFSSVSVPLMTTYVLSRKKGKQVYLDPQIVGGSYAFDVRDGHPPEDASRGSSAGARKAFRCILSGTPISYQYIREQANAGKMSYKLVAVVAEGKRERVYLPAMPEHEKAVLELSSWTPPVGDIFTKGLGISVGNYGLTKWADLFTPRQIASLATFSSLIDEVRSLIESDAIEAGVSDDSRGLAEGGSGARAYADAVAINLSFVVDKLADLGNTLCRWESIAQCPRNLFGKQTISMVWDFAEANGLGKSSGSWHVLVDGFAKALAGCFKGARGDMRGSAIQAAAQTQQISRNRFVSTDPPYYDNIGYADLSDFFYVWLRASVRPILPQLFGTMSVPKDEELVATPGRHGGRVPAEEFFLEGMRQAMGSLARQSHPSAPITIYYAFKQSDTEVDGTISTGWATFLAAVLDAGLCISGTWPVRTENSSRMRGMSSNALASSVVLVCRPRPANAGVISRRQFVRMLNETLPLALDAMTRESEGLHSPVAPVDLSQAIIGPGMAIFSRYEAVLEADGTPMSVKTALQLINRFLAEDDFDADTQFCLHWFEQHGWDAGKFGEADTLARAKGTSVDGVKHAGVVEAGGGSVRLLRWKEYPTDWDPRADSRLPVWEALHHMIRVYQTEGDSGAATVLAAVARMAEPARQLAYRLYTLCERKGWAEDARAYNAVVAGWGAIEQAAAKVAKPAERSLFEIEEVES